MTTPGQRLKQVRQALHLSMGALGESLGVSSAAVSYWESGKTEIPKSSALALQAVYGYRWEWLMTGEGPEKLQPLSITKTPAAAVMVRVFEGPPEFEEDSETVRPVDNPEAQQAYPFRLTTLRPMLKRCGAGHVGTLALIRIPADENMMPLLPGGGLMLVNTSLALRSHPPTGALVLVPWGEGVAFRRAFPQPPPRGGGDHSLPLHTENPTTPGRSLWIPAEGLDRLVLGVVCI